MSDLRTKLIRLASKQPKGSNERKALLAALSDNINVRLMEREIRQFMDRKLSVLEGAEEPVASAARDARIALAKLLGVL